MTNPIPNRAYDLLRKMLPSDDYDVCLLKFYICCQHLTGIVEAGNWLYPHAAVSKNAAEIAAKLNAVWLQSIIKPPDAAANFDDVYDVLKPLTLREFLLWFAPDFVTQLDKTLALLDSVETAPENRCLLLIQCKKEYLRAAGENRPPERYEKALRKLVTEEERRTLMYAVNCYEFSYLSKIDKASKKANAAFQKHQIPVEVRLEWFNHVRRYVSGQWIGRNKGRREEIKKPFQYLWKCLKRARVWIP